MNTKLDRDLAAIVAAFFAVNVRNLLAEPERLDSLAQVAGIPSERVPAVRDALRKANSMSLSS